MRSNNQLIIVIYLFCNFYMHWGLAEKMSP